VGKKLLRLHLERSNSWIAEDLGTTKEIVDTVRGKLESGGEIRPLDILKGKDGKEYPRSSYISDDIKQEEVEREEAVEIGLRILLRKDWLTPGVRGCGGEILLE